MPDIHDFGSLLIVLGLVGFVVGVAVKLPGRKEAEDRKIDRRASRAIKEADKALKKYGAD